MKVLKFKEKQAHALYSNGPFANIENTVPVRLAVCVAGVV
jgi:hypothetical protein